MAGTVLEETHGTMKKVKFTWSTAAASSGAASAVTTGSYSGKLNWVVAVPGSSVAASYDITVTNQDSVDVLGGNGANASNAANDFIVDANLGCVANDKLTLNVTNAGSSADGVVYVYLR